MGYKNILLGVVSSSLFALLSHKLTKRYESFDFTGALL